MTVEALGAIQFDLNPDAVVEEIVRSPTALVLLVDAITAAAMAEASPYLTVTEAATFLRSKRQRVDDLLSSGRLTRYKDGGRTLLLRREVEAYVATTGRRGDTPVTHQMGSRSGSQSQR